MGSDHLGRPSWSTTRIIRHVIRRRMTGWRPSLGEWGEEPFAIAAGLSGEDLTAVYAGNAIHLLGLPAGDR